MDKKTKTLAALIVEDVESDAQLVVRLLKKADYELVYEQVETAEQMRAALEKQTWDIVISDYSLPKFSGEGALVVLKEAGQDVPFIIVSGTMGEETAVAMMKAGAHDYLIKGNLGRLIPAVERELGQAAIRRERRQAGEALAASEAELRALFASMQDVVLVIDRDGVYRKIAPTNLSLLAISTGELLGKNLREVFPAELAEEFIRTIRQTLDEKRTSQIEYEIPINGQLTWFEASISPMNGNDTLWVARDITGRKRAEEALRASEEKYRTLFNNSEVGMFRTRLDGSKILEFNEKYLKILGYTSDELENVPSVNLWVDKRERDNMVQLLNAEGHLTDFECSMLSKQGEIKRCVMSVRLYRDTGILEGSIQDVTARKQAEESLAASEAKLRALVEQVPTTIYTEAAESQKALYISPQVERLTGYTSAEWVEDHELWRKIIHPADVDEVVAVNERTRLTREPFCVEYRILTRDGRTLWIRDEAVLIENQDGTPLFWQGVMYDITERKQIEEAMQTTNILLKQTLEQSPVPMVLVSMPDGIIRSVNSACRHFLGIEDEPSPIGTLLSDIKPSWQAFNMQGNSAGTFEELPLPRSLMGLKTDSQEQRIVRKDGTSVNGLVYASPILDAAGKVIAGYLVMLDITERKRAEEGIHQRVTELEMLYQSGLVLNQSLNPKEIGQKILELLEEKLYWRHTRIRLYHSRDDSLELLDFNRPGLNSEMERSVLVERFQTLIARSEQGMSGWVIQHGQPLRSGDVSNDPRYVEAYPGIRSGLYVPMKLGESIVGVITIEDENPDAFSEADERLIVTLANQAASAFENARLFEETRQRVMELETLNRISLVLRAVTRQNEMLSIVLDEALSILNTSHGSIELYNKSTDSLDQIILRGWIAKLTAPHHVGEGIAGKVFTSGETYISREFVTDPETREIARSQIPPGWGGVCLPIRTTQQTLGVMIVSMPSEHELNKNEIRLLSILSEMTGAALQRMQLHEQTVHRLDQLNALRTVDQAISSSRDMRLTLNVLLTHTVSQLGVDAASVLLLHSGSNLLELVGSRGFRTLLPESVRLGDSFAVHAIMEHRLISARDFEVINKNTHFGRLWKEEGFVCYWCVPLIVKGEAKGVLEVYRRTMFTPDSEWIEFLEALAGQAAIAIDNTQLFENLQRANMDLNLAYDATIEGWSRAMDLRDHETEGHTLRVTDLTMNLARAMHISESQLTAIRRGALLHDIGKMGVPDGILLKETNLTDEEWAVMRKHPELARDMLMPIAYLNDALTIPYCHHEKWDGTGYPQGLKGDQIPLVARIFAVVDVWDALTNDRTYRKKWTKQKACQFIREQSGKHFDPQVVDVFLKQIKKIEQ